MLALKIPRPAGYPIFLTKGIQEAKEHDGVSVPLPTYLHSCEDWELEETERQEKSLSVWRSYLDASRGLLDVRKRGVNCCSYILDLSNKKQNY